MKIEEKFYIHGGQSQSQHGGQSQHNGGQSPNVPRKCLRSTLGLCQRTMKIEAKVYMEAKVRVSMEAKVSIIEAKVHMYPENA